MAKKFYGPKYEKEQKQKKRYERKVLQHLREHGPRSKDSLIVMLDQPTTTGNIGEAVEELIRWDYVERKDGMAMITAKGLSLLEDSEYWR